MKTTLSSLTLVVVFAAATPAVPAQGDPFIQALRQSDHLEPARSHPAQQAAIAGKLAELEQRTVRKPNILTLLVDDMGWGEPGAFSGGIAIGAPTRKIDELARGGLKLTSTYAQPTCPPTRSARMIGRLPVRTGLTRQILTCERVRVNPWVSELTAAALLSTAGYLIALSGKWHLGEAYGYQPHQVGYGEYLGVLGVSSEYVQGLDERRYPDMIPKPERLAALHKVSVQAITTGKRRAPAQVVEPLDSLEKLAEIDQQFADYSVDFICLGTNSCPLGGHTA